MDDRDQLIIDLKNQLQKSNELNQKSLEYLQRDKEIIEKKESELQTWRKIEQKESEVDLQEAAKVLKLPYIKNKTLGQNLLFDFLFPASLLACTNSAKS